MYLKNRNWAGYSRYQDAVEDVSQKQAFLLEINLIMWIENTLFGFKMGNVNEK
jgi:hypothetical protein